MKCFRILSFTFLIYFFDPSSTFNEVTAFASNATRNDIIVTQIGIYLMQIRAWLPNGSANAHRTNSRANGVPTPNHTPVSPSYSLDRKRFRIHST
jgi:hypothetical protein